MFAAPQVSLSAFAFLFSELVQYSQTRVSNIGELERRCGLYFCCLPRGAGGLACVSCSG